MQQLIIDEPIIAFYHNSTNLSELSTQSVRINSEIFQSVENLKVHLFPEAKNQILVRLENLSDLFDGNPESI